MTRGKRTPSSSLPPSPTPRGAIGVVYGGVRLLHLLLVTASLPLGHFAFTMDARPDVASRVLVTGVAFFLTLMVLAMDQATYPVTLPAALLRTVPLVVVVGVGLWSHDAITTMAWRNVASLLTALSLSFALVGVRAAAAMPVAFFAGLAALVVGWPLVEPLVAARTDPAAAPLTSTGVVGAVAWLVQTATTTKGWYGQSVFGGPPSAAQQERSIAMTRWSGVMVAMMAAAFLAFAVIAFW